MKKSKLIVASSAAAIGVLGLGAFAFFSDKTEDKTEGNVGTIDIEGKDEDGSLGLELGNKENINPGDETNKPPKDPDDPPTPPYEDPQHPNKTTPHDLTFGIKNTGTKSVITRNIIDIKVTSKEGENLDPKKFYLQEKDLENLTNTDIADLEDLKVAKFTYENEDGETILRYVIQGASLNGTAGKLEDNDFTEQSGGDRDSADVNAGATEVSYTYYLGMAPDSGDKYQGAVVDITVTVQAMQNRNTTPGDYVEEDGDWETVFQDTVSTAKNGSAVEGNDQTLSK